MKKELLISQTVANINDTIRFSVLINQETKKYIMPSLVVIRDDNEEYYADNAGWIKETLYPALQRFQNREWTKDDKENVEDFVSSLGTIYDQLEGVKETLEILSYAIENNMLNNEQEVQVSDTTKLNQGTKS